MDIKIGEKMRGLEVVVQNKGLIMERIAREHCIYQLYIIRFD